MTDHKFIGSIIRKLRVSEGYSTQKEIAQRLRITSTYLCSIENGTAQPSYKLLKRMAHIFMVPVSLLVAWDDEPESDIERKLQALFSKLLDAKLASTPS